MFSPSVLRDLGDFFVSLVRYCKIRFQQFFHHFERLKSSLAGWLYQQRGRYARPFIHLGMIALVAGAISLGPIVITESLQQKWESQPTLSSVFSVEAADDLETATLISKKPRAEAFEYVVRQGDTLSIIAEQFNISMDTITWENDLKSAKDIKVGQALRILPATGILHKVKPGETIYSLAKKYQTNAQAIVDWPYNSFANDETFALAVGQELMLPDGVMPKEAPVVSPRYYAQVPAAGTIAGTGQFVWPASGRISQGFKWYHQAVDIANSGAPEVLAADAGFVTVVGWPAPWDYGNRVIIDHGNGFVSWYAHLSQIFVNAGQTVARGQAVGRMGSTGRSTGTHLHFEIHKGGVKQDPLAYLK